MTTAPDLEHGPDCTGPDLRTFTGRRGDEMLSCRGCLRVRQLEAGEVSPTPQAPPERRPPRAPREFNIPHPDTHDARQANRAGNGWPAHRGRARRRAHRRRQQQRRAAS